MTGMILCYEHGHLSERKTYRAALSIESAAAPVISLVGAGGKTTTALHLAQEYVQNRIPVAVTASTHMHVWEEPWFLLTESEEQFEQILQTEGQVWFGLPAVRKSREDIPKMQPVSRAFFSYVADRKIPMIVEADGARRMPCKAPGEQEPVLYRETTDVLAVYGLDAVGRTIEEVCFRPEIVAKILQKSVSECLMPEDVAHLALSRRGGRKNVLSKHRYCVILNKADSRSRLETAERICKEIRSKENVQVLVTADKKARRSCRHEDID